MTLAKKDLRLLAEGQLRKGRRPQGLQYEDPPSRPLLSADDPQARVRGDEGEIRGRQGLRPQAPLGRHQALDQVGLARERDRHRHGADLRQYQLSRLRQEPRRLPLAHDRRAHRLQRGRLFRPLPQVLRLRRPRAPGQGLDPDHRLHRRQRGPRTVLRVPRGHSRGQPPPGRCPHAGLRRRPLGPPPSSRP